jgi:hypothetical protein
MSIRIRWQLRFAQYKKFHTARSLKCISPTKFLTFDIVTWSTSGGINVILPRATLEIAISLTTVMLKTLLVMHKWIDRSKLTLPVGELSCIRRVWRYQRGIQNPYIEEEHTTQWPKEKVQKYKQPSTKHTHKTKDRVTRTH